MATSDCRLCGIELIPTKYNRQHFYCSKYCREKHWRINNPERMAEHKLRFANKKPKTCEVCWVDLERGKNHRFCSKCSRARNLESAKRHRIKRKNMFHHFKESCGCYNCNWDLWGCSLDFHHFSDIKKGRITASNWHHGNGEYDNCVLLCKNCHYGEHHGHVDLDFASMPNYSNLMVQFLRKENRDI